MLCFLRQLEMLICSNGLSTQDTSRNEGTGQTRQVSLQCEAHTADGGPRPKDRYISIENSTQTVPSFLVKEVNNVADLIEKIRDHIPALMSPTIGLRISDSRGGTTHRRYFKDFLPEDAEFLYVSLFLNKHPQIDFRKN